MKKTRTSIYLSDNAMKLIEKNYRFVSCKTHSDFIENAIEYYCAFIHADESKAFFQQAFLSTFKGVMASFEDRISRLLFKNAVEISMLLHVISATENITQADLARLRGTCVVEVKKNNGNISFEEALKYQKGGK